jgi:hypothetical protein
VVYRIARISIPSFSRSMLTRKVPGPQLQSVDLYTSADYFVMDLMVQNMDLGTRQMEKVLDEIEKKTKKEHLKRTSKLSESLASVIIEETKGTAGSNSSSGFGSGQEYKPKKSPPKLQPPSGHVLKESIYPMALLNQHQQADHFEHLVDGSSEVSSDTSDGSSPSISDDSDSTFTSGQTEV